jgi:hypothetical protein
MFSPEDFAKIKNRVLLVANDDDRLEFVAEDDMRSSQYDYGNRVAHGKSFAHRESFAHEENLPYWEILSVWKRMFVWRAWDWLGVEPDVGDD